MKVYLHIQMLVCKTMNYFVAHITLVSQINEQDGLHWLLLI